MIYDSLSKLDTYRGLSKNFDTAIDYLSKTDLGSLPIGKHTVSGDAVFAIAQAYETKDPATAKFEAHRKYIDIQIVLEGAETCYSVELAGLAPDAPFDADKDIGFYREPSAASATTPLRPGLFVAYFTHDAHKPSCAFGAPGKKIRKIVVKVAV